MITLRRLVFLMLLALVSAPLAASAQTTEPPSARRAQPQKRDSIWNGVLIGAAVGAAPGVYWLMADPNECTGLCPEEYGFIAAGALIGGLIDWAIYKKDGRPAVTLTPVVTRRRTGLQIALKF